MAEAGTRKGPQRTPALRIHRLNHRFRTSFIVWPLIQKLSAGYSDDE
jgi:hypothetical protein